MCYMGFPTYTPRWAGHTHKSRLVFVFMLSVLIRGCLAMLAIAPSLDVQLQNTTTL